MELVPENCCQNMIMKAIRKRLRLPGVRHSFQVTPSVALSSSSIEALISAISIMIWGSSTVLHRMWARKLQLCRGDLACKAIWDFP